MSKKSLKSNRNGKDSGSDEEDEEGLQEALKELVKIPDIETIEDKDKNKDEREVKKQRKSSLKVPKNQVEQGSQTVDNREKANPLKPYLSKIDSDDSWTTIFIRRFSWNKNPKSESTPPEVKPNIDKEKQNAVEIISKQVKENIKDIKGDGLHKIKSSPESSSERLIRTEHYGYSIPRTWETKNNTHDLSDEESEEDTPEFIEKLRKIEEASKPKTWKRPQPTIIKNKLYSSSHKSRENQLEVKSNKDNEEQHRYINILNAPFQRNLKYPAVDETNNPLTLNKVSEDKDTQSIDPEKETPEGVPIESAAPQNVAQKSHKLQGKKSKEKFKEKKADTTDSQRTLTITGHSHITTKWDNHCHFRENQHGVDKKARRILIIACVLCFVFLIVEVVGGVVSNSLAIATDAAHLLTDLASFLISLFALYLAGRPSSERLSFGWYRAEVIGAMISVFFIWVITGEWHPCLFGDYALG
ncbi:uncharacterized protein LOC108101999 isoform X2 [Drosophila ficusphila]|uniref:uncharacterized protein LOC108101999 isoform X2 n=1 Tax=Drosophila ficusphila TaxID=30025 RepID=UPI0007E5F24E|nr:uncharacterized protein LOC108101999 isoform X2 [Drosophila ficusphila]